jgi:hypothetical protein
MEATMMTIVAVTGFANWAVLVGAAIAGVAFGMLINSLHGGGRRKK